MSGFVGLTSSTLVRRLTTRALAIVPALCVQIIYGAEGTYRCVFVQLQYFGRCRFRHHTLCPVDLCCTTSCAATCLHCCEVNPQCRIADEVHVPFACRMLVIAQVVLAMQLPFTLIPLIKSTSSRAIMGVFASSWMRSLIAWAASFVVFTANLLMLVDMLWMESPEQVAAREEEQGFADKGFDEWLAQVMDVMTRYGASVLHCLTSAVSLCASYQLPHLIDGGVLSMHLQSSGYDNVAICCWKPLFEMQITIAILEHLHHGSCCNDGDGPADVDERASGARTWLPPRPESLDFC